ncbi:MAG TPA: hypothetical protein VHK90_12440 [Thermoanaerobaculia bacterium]|nr:hypothetical protein [Thermoanaerobaculia bacterium]
MKQRALVAVVLFTSIMFLAACREEGKEKDETWMGASTDTSGTASETASATHPGSPGGTAVVPDVDTGTTVLVLMEDNSIAVREQAIPPGPAVLTIENRGSEVHNLFVEGEGISRAADNPVPEGQSATMDVVFRPGTYTLYCPILDHRTKGEEVTITIAAP